LLTFGLLAIASLEMLVLIHFDVKGGDVSREYNHDGILPFLLEIAHVFAADFIAITILSTLSIILKAVTVQFETHRVLALASLTPHDSWLILLDLKQLLLSFCHFHDLHCFLFDLLLLLLNIVFILLFRIKAGLFGV
jgi:hypothetical protein